MPRPSSLRPPLPAALLLGLLALLLWGQCAGLLYQAARTPPTLRGQVSSTDSLRWQPPTLFLTLNLANTLPQPATVQDVSGVLRFGHRRFPFSAAATLRGRRLLVFEELQQTVAVAVPLPADSLALLHTILRESNARSGQVSLSWEIWYTTTPEAGAPVPGRTSPYLPQLAAPRPY